MAIVHDLDSLSSSPALGDEVLLPVVQSATRSTLFPDQAVVSSTPEFLELVLLRQEVLILRQKGRVVESSPGEFGVQIQGTEVRPTLYDIGHVRFPLAQGVELALSILGHVVKNNGMDKSELLARINAAMSA
jgi:hypothetical protein